MPLENHNRSDERAGDEHLLHNHEFQGSTRYAGAVTHNHRFAGITSQAIPVGNSHIHRYNTSVDFFLNHIHGMSGETGPAIPVGGDRHVHFASGETTFDAAHLHTLIFATLIENPSET